MYLKNVEMRGFKSFADATELDFGAGITAIVGPNGVGKSNISDAVLWVLGEQSYKTLRTESSQDVIFAGTDNRRPLSMAEVSLTFDNTNGRLPTDFSEVNISRRLFRTGESQYLINKSVCRLRDVRDLLLGTGVGPDAYSVIGQGEIAAILSIRSEDRRELIEEVAGIRKYRIRRDEASRKLERTEANLTRISDIVYELSNQREPLEREAEVARQYKEFDDRLRTLELQLLSRDYQKLNEHRGQAANDAAIAKADLAATRGKISEIEAEHSKLKAALDQKDSALEKLHLVTAEARQRAADARQERAVNLERLRAAEARLAAVEADIKAQQQRVELLNRQIQELQQARDELTGRLAEAEAALDEQKKLCEQAELSHEEREQAISDLVEKRNEALREVAALENEAAALEALQADLEERAQRVQSQQEALQQRVGRLESDIERTNQEREQINEALKQAAAARGHCEAALAASLALLRDHRVKREQLAAAISRLEERRDVLTELREAYEGYPEGLRAVIAAAKARKLSGVRGVVGDLLDVPRKLETAIQAGLGDRLGWVITTSQSEAVNAVAYLQSEDLGRAVFFPMSASVGHTSGPRLSGMSGKVLGIADQLVKFPKEFARVFEILLGDLVVCADLPTALDAFQRFAGRYRMVTLDGVVIERNGAIRSGPTDVPGAQSFGRRRELDNIEHQLVGLRTCLAELWQTEEQLDAEVQRQRALLQEADDGLATLNTSAAQAEKEISHLGSTQQAVANALAENQDDVNRLQGQIERTAERYQQVVGECTQHREQARVTRDEIDRLRASVSPEASVEQMRSELTDRQVGVAEIRERLNSAQEVLQRATEDLERVTAEHQATLAQQQQLQEQQEQLQQAIGGEDDDTKELEAEVARLEQQMREQIENAAQLREQVAALETSMRTLADAATQQNERLHQAEITLTREEGRIQNTIERLADTYDMTPEQALEVQDEGLDEVAARREARALRSEIRRLGHVNLSAIAEYERLSAREEFLTSQEQDLRQARDDLLKVIADIDAAAEAAFIEVFQAVQEAFDEMFQRLFDGGHTKLLLTDEQHPLQAGVDIIAQLPGKKAQNLLLLSGGERAKVAIALLFAMLKVNPSPFCLLDEIDAALDDANTERFGDILQDFARDTQFIIITHNPHTMERVDKLHGITMEEPGVSKVITVKLQDAQEQAEQQAKQQRNAVPAE